MLHSGVRSKLGKVQLRPRRIVISLTGTSTRFGVRNLSTKKDSFILNYVGIDNFKPESIDSSKPGTIDIKRGKDSTSVTVERSSAQVCPA